MSTETAGVTCSTDTAGVTRFRRNASPRATALLAAWTGLKVSSSLSIIFRFLFVHHLVAPGVPALGSFTYSLENDLAISPLPEAGTTRSIAPATRQTPEGSKGPMEIFHFISLPLLPHGYARKQTKKTLLWKSTNAMLVPRLLSSTNPVRS